MDQQIGEVIARGIAQIPVRQRPVAQEARLGQYKGH